MRTGRQGRHHRSGRPLRVDRKALSPDYSGVYSSFPHHAEKAARRGCRAGSGERQASRPGAAFGEFV